MIQVEYNEKEVNSPMNPYHDWQLGGYLAICMARKCFFWNANVQIKAFEFIVTRDRVVHSAGY
jgi:hypothetical protein